MGRESDAVIHLVAKDRRFHGVMNRTLATLQRVRANMQQVSRVARRMLVVAAGAATGVTLAYGSFEKKMSKVKALTQATDEEMARLTNTARELGKSTVFSANQAADAMAAFGLQGFKTNDIIKAMPATLELAAAGQLAMGQAASITAGVMRGMKLPVEELVRVTDNLAKAATSSATDMPLLGESMKALGPTAAAAGVEIEEVTAVLRAMAQVMITGGAAGTAYRNILIRLQKQPTEVRKRLKELNVSIDDGTGKMKHMADIVDDLNAALVSKTQIARSAILADIAGLRAVAAFTELLSVGGDTIREYTREQEKAIGTGRRMAKTMMDNLAGSFTLVTSASSELAINFGQQLRPEIQSLLDNVKNLLDWMNSWETASLQTVISVGKITIVAAALTATLPALVLALEGLIYVVKGLTRAFALLKAAMFFFTPAGRVVKGALFLGTAIGLLAAKMGLFNDAVKAVVKKWGDLKDKISGAGEEMKKVKEFTKEEATRSSLTDEIAKLEKAEDRLERSVKSLRMDERERAPGFDVNTLIEQSHALKFVTDRLENLREALAKVDAPPPTDSNLLKLLKMADAHLKKIKARTDSANKEAAKFLKAIRKEVDALTPGSEGRQLARKLIDLENLGASRSMLDEIRAAAEELQGLREKDDTSSTGRIEGIQDTFRRIQEAAAKGDSQIKKQSQANAKANQSTAKNTDTLIKIGRGTVRAVNAVVDAVRDNVSGVFAP